MVTPSSSSNSLNEDSDLPQQTYNPRNVALEALFSAGLFRRNGTDVRQSIRNFRRVIRLIQTTLPYSNEIATFLLAFEYMISYASKFKASKEKSFNALTLSR